MSKQHFKSTDEITAFKVKTQAQIDDLSGERRKLYDKVSHAETSEEKNTIRKYYEVYTRNITRLRRDLRTADRIIQDIPQMCECIEAERKINALQQQIEAHNRKDRER